VKLGITHIAIIPVRADATSKSEMISQLLFGERYTVLQEEDKWLRIESDYDNYEGWISKNQSYILDDKELKKLEDTENALAFELVHSVVAKEAHIPIVIGSNLPGFDGMNLRLGNRKFTYNGQAIQTGQINREAMLIKKVALRYLNAPYLWGGRSPFGIDCSGFTQMVYKFFDMKLPRDSNQQAEHGSTISFIKEANVGDLAFFDNEEGNITHVGMILEDEKIIHASGKVRIDRIDHYGIYNEEQKKYSHKLRLIKKLN